MSYSHIIGTYVLSSPSWKTQLQFVRVHCGDILERLSSLIEGIVSKNSSIWMNLATANAGCFGSGRAIDSLPSRVTTDDILGLSSGSSCTHKSPICMHLTISDVQHDSIKMQSTNSNTFPSHHSLHAYQYRLEMELFFIDDIHVLLCLILIQAYKR